MGKNKPYVGIKLWRYVIFEGAELGRVTNEQLDMLIVQGKITQEDKEYIMS